MSQDNQGTPAPKDGDGGKPPKDTNGSPDQNSGGTVPQARFNEVNSQKNAAIEKANMWEGRAKELAADSEEQKAQNEQLVADGKDKDRKVWRVNALSSINSEVAKIAEETGITFVGETQEDYTAWATNLETQILPRLKEGKADVDGNRGGATTQEMTAEQLSKMTPEERLEYGKKTIPRFER